MAKKMIKNFGNPKEKEVEKALQKTNEAVRKNELEKAAKAPTDQLEESLEMILDARLNPKSVGMLPYTSGKRRFQYIFFQEN